MGRRKKKKPAGQFCWSCGFRRPNEAFSGNNHARHICRRCSQLEPDELILRQAKVDIERLLRWDRPVIPKRKRPAFECFLEHENERVRRYAEQLLAEDRAERRMLRAIAAHDDGACEAMFAAIDPQPHRPDDSDHLADVDDPSHSDDDDIPF